MGQGCANSQQEPAGACSELQAVCTERVRLEGGGHTPAACATESRRARKVVFRTKTQGRNKGGQGRQPGERIVLQKDVEGMKSEGKMAEIQSDRKSQV